MMLRYPHCAIGYSGHESPDNLRIAVAAVAMGAQILERHIGVPTEDIKLNAYSMNPGQVEQWVQEILAARQICGQKAGGEKRLSESEQSSLRSLARGVFARNAIREGAPLSAEKVFFAMPCSDGQTTTKEYLETLKASKNYNPLAPIEEKRSYDPIQIVRGVVHEAKGLLREAHISIGSEYEIELSHHHGMDNFRRIGAVIINFINREYCKKLIILLPGQFHPSHAHTKKEETFQVIYGELNLTLNGISRIMSPGDIQLVLRGDYHSFSTKTGVIFEEISTTHIKGDSTYEDAKINKLDPILRKTVPESW
jgi:N-acetylneuraminate synthase